MSVNELLDTLFEELEASKKSFMSSKKLVDTDKCLDLIDDIRDNLPVELERAGNIIKERRQILADGEKEAQQYIEEAQRQAAQLVSETSIIKQAQQEAERIVTEAKQSAKEIRLGAKAYANDVLEELENYDEIDHTQGLSNIEAQDGYMLEDELTARQFSEMADLDYEAAQMIYTAYAIENEEYGQIIGNFASYKVPLVDMFLYVCDEADTGIVSLSQEDLNDLHDARDQMESALAQLQGDDYNRVLIYLSPSLEPGQTTYEFTNTIRSIARKYYPDGELYMAGDATNEYDFQKSFAIDNVVVSVVSIFIVLLVLLFTFQSVGMPILLIVVIQGAIWINFSFPYFMGTNLYFMGYLIVSSIQMGANIDYAIVIATRFNELKDKMEHKQAMIETINFAFPTILTSGTIMTVSGILIGQMTSDACIVGIGQCLGRGTIISIILVLFVLPQILLIGTRIVDRTSFAVPKLVARSSGNGRMRVNGIVQGEIHGSVAGTMNAIVDGDVQLTVISGNVSQELDDNKQQEVQNEDQ